MVPVTELPHLAAAAVRRGETDRKVLVDLPAPQQVRTPGRAAGQWLGSGQKLRPVRPQYWTEEEIEQAEQAKREPIPGHPFADLTSNREREEMER
ncbi:hypothetical protein [Nocardia testacea]|uniref:hypothetical protein n=1 Tax=Nocardia testacea TaxID=248551 RepID=UPI0005855772|nr:hypothetical protein [Nocardia testacea]